MVSVVELMQYISKLFVIFPIPNCIVLHDNAFGRFNDSQTMIPFYPWRKPAFAGANALCMNFPAGNGVVKGLLFARDGLLI